MGSEPSPTPKLSLFLLPSKPNEPLGLPITPMHSLASVPFQWEEAPGKPRPCTTTNQLQPKSKTTRFLELPPRLLCEAKVNNMPSPTTILDGPYLGHSLSRSRSLSFGKGMPSFSSLENLGLGRRGNKGRVIFGSSRWGSFRRNKEGVEDSVVFSSSPVFDSGDGGVGTKVKITRIRRKSSFLSFSSTKSHLWTNIYESFKQVVPWRRRHQRNSETSR